MPISSIGVLSGVASIILRIIAAMSMGMRYAGNDRPAFLISGVMIEPIPIEIPIIQAALKKDFSVIVAFCASVSSSSAFCCASFPFSSLHTRLYLSFKRFAIGPPIKQPDTKPYVAEAIATTVAPATPRSSK